jgi:transcriptional regulator
MYTPAINAEHDTHVLHQFIRANSLCALITQSTQGMVASHIPMVLMEDGSEFGMLKGHVARANTQWKDITAPEALGIFTGPQHYISPNWYPEKATHGKEVPTWNYVAVHAYGPIRIVQDADWLLDHLKSLTNQHEAVSPIPWRVEDAPQDFIAKMIHGIVGIEFPITRIEARWKASQNRPDRDIAGITAGLDTLATPASETMKDLILSKRPR